LGDWYVDRDGAWAYDRNAPAPDPSVTGMLPSTVEQSAKLPEVHPEQDDLSEYDADPELEIVPTEKLGPLDEVLIQPPQEPDWRNPREAS
jgi:hypothetical protein